MLPPKVLNSFDLAFLPHWPNLSLDICKWFLVQRRISFGHGIAKINDPLASGAPLQVHAVDPGFEHVGIGPPVWVCGQAKPLTGEVAGNVERSVFNIALKRSALVARQWPRASQIKRLRCKVCINTGYRGPIQEGRMDGLFVGKAE